MNKRPKATQNNAVLIVLLALVSACSSETPMTAPDLAIAKSVVQPMAIGAKITLSNIRLDVSNCNAKFVFSGLSPNGAYYVGWKDGGQSGAGFNATSRGTASVSYGFAANKLDIVGLYTQSGWNTVPAVAAVENLLSTFALNVADRCAAYSDPSN